jgi:hypothetical protein
LNLPHKTRNIHVVITGRIRDFQVFNNLLSSLLSANIPSMSVVFSTWHDEVARWSPQSLAGLQHNGIQILQAGDGPHLDSPGNYFRQVLLLKNAARKLIENGYQDSDLILKIRPDLITQDPQFLNTLLINQKKRILENSDFKFWTIHCDLLEPFYGCDIIYMAPIESILNLDNYVVVEHGHAKLRGLKNSFIRIEASLFSRLLGYEFSKAYLDLVNSDFYGSDFNLPPFRMKIFMLLKNDSLKFSEAYRSTLDDWHKRLAQIVVGHPLLEGIKGDIWLYQKSNKGNWDGRSVYFESSNVSKHFFNWAKVNHQSKFHYQISQTNLVNQDNLKAMFIKMYNDEKLIFSPCPYGTAVDINGI